MKMDSNSLIDPILLFLLSQIAVVLPVIIPFQKTAVASVPPPPPVVRERPQRPVAPMPDLEALRRELERAEQAARAAATQAGQAEQDRHNALREAAQLADALRVEAQRRQTLETQGRQLEDAERLSREQAQQAAQERQQTTREMTELDRALRDRRTLIASLEKQLKESGGLAEGDQEGGSVMTRSTKRAAWIEIVNNRVVPVDEQYYRIENRLTNGGFATIHTRKGQGETLEEAQRSGSGLRRFLQQRDPGKTFIACNVYPE